MSGADGWSAACIEQAVTKKRAWLLGLGIALAVLVSAVVVLLVLAGPLAERAVESARVDLEKRLGRTVTLREVDVSPFSGKVRMNGIAIGWREPEPTNAPALTVDAVFADVAVWRTLRTFGRRIHVETVEVARPTVTVVKRRDGTLNWQEIAERLREEEDEEPSGEPRRVRVSRGAVRDGTIRFVEQGRGGEPATISKLDVAVEDFAPDAGGRVALQAAVLATERNLELDARVDDLEDRPLLAALQTLRLELQPTPLEPLAPFLAAMGSPESTPEAGVLSADVHFKKAEAAHSTGKGRIALEKARFPGGKPFDGALELDITVDRSADALVVRDARLQAAEMKLFARANVRALRDAPRVEDLDVRSEALDFSRLRAIYPHFRSLTEPLELTGPFSIQATGGGSAEAQSIELTVTLTDAGIRLEDKLEKPRGTPASARASLRNAGRVVTLERGTLDLSTWQLAATGRAQRREDGKLQSYTLALTTPRPDAEGLVRLLPPVARAFPKAHRLGGRLDVTARLEGAGDASTAKGNVQIADLDVRAPETRFRGGGSVRFDVKRDAAGALAGEVRAAFSELEAVYLDVIDKPKGTPLELTARFDREGDHSRASFDARLASLAATGQAKLREEKQRDGSTAQAYTADISLAPFAVRPLLAIVPSASETEVPDVRFEAMKIHAAGVLGRPSATRLSIPRFAARSGRSDLRGSLELANATNPQITFAGRSSYLDVEDFLPTSEKSAKKPEKPAQKPPSPLAEADGRITLVVDRGRAMNVPYEKLNAELLLEDGRATAKTLDVQAFGGRFSGNGSEVPVFVDEGPYRLRGSLEAMQLQELLARFAGNDRLMTGILGATFDLSASDTTPEALRRSLTGRLRGGVKEAEFLPGNAVGAFIQKLQAVPGAQGIGRGKAEQLGSWQLDDLSGSLVFEDGAAVIAEPITASTPQGPLAVRGKLRLGGPVDLTGTMQLEAGSLEQLVGTDLALDQPLPLEFRITGSLTDPQFSFGNLQAAMQPILQAYLKRSFGAETEPGVREAVRGVFEGQPSKGEEKEPKRDERKPRDAEERPEEQKQEEQKKEPTTPRVPSEGDIRRRIDRLF